MNRMKEYQELRMELEKEVVDMKDTLERAVKRKKRKMRVWRSVAGMAAAFALFVTLVNMSSGVAYACAKIPVLRELAEAVKFSKSLTAAVENEHVQKLDIVQESGDVTVKLEYMIVDQKQVNVFYRLYSKSGVELNAVPDVWGVNGELPPSCGFSFSGWGIANGDLRNVKIEYTNVDVPEQFLLKLDVVNTPDLPIDPIATFEFVLEPEPIFTSVSKEFVMNETVVLDGQKITIKNVEVYPTHMRINIEDDVNNTAWLKRLDFYIVTDTGKTFEPVSNGVTATGGDTPTMVSFRADSTYFEDAKGLKLIITGAEWLTKEKEKVYLNLEKQEAEGLPEGVELMSAKKTEDGWMIQLCAEKREGKDYHNILSAGDNFYDKEGNVYRISSVSYLLDLIDLDDKYFVEELELKGFQGSEVWVLPAYSHEWSAGKEVIVEIY